MKISVFKISRRQQVIILFLMFLLYYLPCYIAASIVLILWGLLEGRICGDPDFPAHTQGSLRAAVIPCAKPACLLFLPGTVRVQGPWLDAKRILIWSLWPAANLLWDLIQSTSVASYLDQTPNCYQRFDKPDTKSNFMHCVSIWSWTETPRSSGWAWILLFKH